MVVRVGAKIVEVTVGKVQAKFFLTHTIFSPPSDAAPFLRYFDIRVATRESKFYFVHGLFGADLQPLLSEVRLFLAQHPGEVVMLDFQHFHGLSEQDHAALVALLKSTFATTLCPMFNYPHNLTLDLLARLKYQVIRYSRSKKMRERKRRRRREEENGIVRYCAWKEKNHIR